MLILNELKSTNMMKNLIVLQILILALALPALAIEDFENEDTDPITAKAVTSMEAYSETGKQTAVSLGLAAEYALNEGQIDKAIKWCKLGLERDYNDLDIHMTYAKALQEKLKTKKERDLDMYNECIKEWLIVYRTEVGDEKGISFHGISPLGHYYEDEERSIPARSHLVALTGRAPKPWETDAKYLKWVNRPSTAVSGKLLSTK